jgi:hypothetical protein
MSKTDDLELQRHICDIESQHIQTIHNKNIHVKRDLFSFSKITKKRYVIRREEQKKEK